VLSGDRVGFLRFLRGGFFARSHWMEVG
jgi:hypothetical protein